MPDALTPWPHGPPALRGVPPRQWLTSQLEAVLGLARKYPENVEPEMGEWYAVLDVELWFRMHNAESVALQDTPDALQTPDALDEDAAKRGWFDDDD